MYVLNNFKKVSCQLFQSFLTYQTNKAFNKYKFLIKYEYFLAKIHLAIVFRLLQKFHDFGNKIELSNNVDN